MSKPLTYAMALGEHGPDIDAKIGLEPSGRAFNEISVDSRRRPLQPMINAGRSLRHRCCFRKIGKCARVRRRGVRRARGVLFGMCRASSDDRRRRVPVGEVHRIAQQAIAYMLDSFQGHRYRPRRCPRSLFPAMLVAGDHRRPGSHRYHDRLRRPQPRTGRRCSAGEPRSACSA